ncbi:hypothetical protein QR680_013188 [Steinernema hermaphroditum]|uniref:Phosphatidic acid phosphatase type 2/haloperoxidase domain-containing protein n=1 Tax=Steinernema hermaphroditum TaxID=289476 RepID=A0AA39M1U6_9BILA|nr:hypothetical protein QR680_013188 [Steinernema hermaphroditum]
MATKSKRRTSNVADAAEEHTHATISYQLFSNWNSHEEYYVQAPIDKILGPNASFHLRTHLTQLILAGNPAIQFLQQLENPRVTAVAHFFTALGLEPFFFSLVASSIWLFDARLGRLLAILLAVGFFVCGSLKVLFCLPRPPSPPALRLSEEDRDWAWPSNHALLSTLFSWFIWIYSNAHYEMDFTTSIILLAAIFTWNAGVMWSRVCLGVHSPCDVVGGWIIGVVLLFVFSGFSDRIHHYYLWASRSQPEALLLFTTIAAFALYAHPRAWPETQSYGELVSVLSGALIGVISSRCLLLGGNEPPRSLMESERVPPLAQYAARFFIGCTVTAVARLVVKVFVKRVVTFVYLAIDLPFYSYSQMCKESEQPTKRFTWRMRYLPVDGKTVVDLEKCPFDIDLPVKFVVYAVVGFMVGEGCPHIFQRLGI